MKILAIVEIDQHGRIISTEPERTYKENAEPEKIDLFFRNAETLRNKSRQVAEMTREEETRLSAKFVGMGFVHESELDKFLEKKITEIHNRIGMAFYYDYYVKRPAKKLRFWALGKIGVASFKLFKKIRNEPI